MSNSIYATEFYYKILDHLPLIPEAFLHHTEFAKAITRPCGMQFPGYSGYSRSDGKETAPNIISTKIPSNLLMWINEKITPTHTKSVWYRKVIVDDDNNNNFYPAHVDISRRFTLLYNIVDSGGELVFWKEKDQPIFRELAPGPFKDYSRLEELCRFPSPHKKWYLLNSQVIHGVENLGSVRENIQIECRLTDQIVIDYLKPLV